MYGGVRCCPSLSDAAGRSSIGNKKSSELERPPGWSSEEILRSSSAFRVPRCLLSNKRELDNEDLTTLPSGLFDEMENLIDL